MSYLVFDHEGEMLDVLNFDSTEELALFKAENPTYIVKQEDLILEEDDFAFDEDDLSDIIEDDEEW
jgi:hypothetical protein